MLKLILSAFAVFVLSLNLAWAAVDANKATQAELETIRGIGPAISQRIIEERSKNGPFKSLDDLESRVKGVGEATIKKMADAGLTVGGSGLAKPAKADSKMDAKADAKHDAKHDNKLDTKADKAAKTEMKAEKSKDAKESKEKPAEKAGKAADKAADKASGKAADAKAEAVQDKTKAEKAKN